MAPSDRDSQHPRSREVHEVASLFRPTPRGRCVVIDGDSGIGKSWLLEQATAAAAASGWSHVPVRAEQELAGAPLGALPDAIRPSPVAGGDQAAVTFAVDRIESLTITAPVLLTVDDAQWLDPLSCRLLSALAPKTGAWPLVLAVAKRPWPRPVPLLRTLEDLIARDPQEVHLGPLNDDETRALAERAAGGHTLPRHVTDLVAKAGGNPFYILTAVRTAGSGPPPDPGADPPARLRAAVLRRVAECGPDVERVLRLAAVIGNDFHVSDLELLSGEGAAALATPLHAATRAGVLTDSPSAATLRFTHDLVRETILADCPAALRVALHRDAAVVLGDAGAPASRIAEQWAQAVVAGSADVEQATCWLRRAAADCPSPVTALGLLDRAKDLLPAGHPRARDVRRDRLPALAASGRHADALATAAALLSEGEDPELRGWHGLALMGKGQVIAALADLDSLAATAAGLNDPAVIPFTALGATLRLWFGERRRAVATCTRLERSELDDATRSALLTTRSLASLAAGDVPEAIDLARRAVTVADPGALPRAVVVDPHMALGNALVHVDDFAGAESCFRLVARSSFESGVDPPPGYHWGLVGVRYFSGQLEDAAAEATAGLEQATETGESWGCSVGVALRARCQLHQGRLDDTATLPAPGTAVPGFADDWLLWVRALAAEARGEDESAAEDAARAWRLLPDLRYLYGWHVMAADVVRLTRHLDRDTAAEVCRDTATGAVRAGREAASAQATADWCRGLLENDPDLLGGAATVLAREGWRCRAARAAEDHADALLHHGDRDRAVTAFRNALVAWDAVGAAHDRRRVAAQLRRLGVATRARAPRAGTRTGWGALTPSERDVCALVAEGLTSREIGERLLISRRTVETHLQHTYRKLGVSNRAHLVSATAGRLSGEDG